MKRAETLPLRHIRITALTVSTAASGFPTSANWLDKKALIATTTKKADFDVCFHPCWCKLRTFMERHRLVRTGKRMPTVAEELTSSTAARLWRPCDSLSSLEFFTSSSKFPTTGTVAGVGASASNAAHCTGLDRLPERASVAAFHSCAD